MAGYHMWLYLLMAGHVALFMGGCLTDVPLSIYGWLIKTYVSLFIDHWLTHVYLFMDGCNT